MVTSKDVELPTGYVILRVVAEDKVYRWVEAEDEMGGSCLLQILIPGQEPALVNTLFDYFENLQSIHRRGLLTPEQAFSDTDHPLVLRYRILSASPLSMAARDNGSRLTEWLAQTCELLHAVHNRGLSHGCLTTEAIMIGEDNRLFLDRFGYAPLLAAKHPGSQQCCKSFLAPEIIHEGKLTPAGDIFGLAMVAAALNPAFRSTEIFLRCTAENPAERPRRIRDLKFTFQEASTKSGGIVPKFPVRVSVTPLEGGEVSGIGNYQKGTSISLSAEANTGWRFDRWQGIVDDSPSVNPLTFTVEGPLEGIAHFVRDLTPPPPQMYHVRTQVEPAGSGIVVGAGQFPRDTQVVLEAKPAAGWRFAGWSGHLTGHMSQATVKLQSDLVVTARFVRQEPVDRVDITATVEPSGIGFVDGTGSHAIGTTVLLGARPNNIEWRFDHWSGDITGTKNPLSLYIDGAKHFKAHFSPSPWALRRIDSSAEPSRAGVVRGTGNYRRGETVTLEAIPNKGWSFSHWTGDAAGNTPLLRVSVDSDKHINAHFVASSTSTTPAWATPASGQPEQSDSGHEAAAKDKEDPPSDNNPLGKAFR